MSGLADKLGMKLFILIFLTVVCRTVFAQQDNRLKLCSFYTDQTMIDCPQALFIRSDLINDPKLEPFLALKVHLEEQNRVDPKDLKKVRYLDNKLRKCTYYTDQMMVDCPQGLYVRNDLVKDPKIVQFIKNKKEYDQQQISTPLSKTKKD